MPFNKSLHPALHLDPGMVCLAGRVLLGASGAVSTITGSGVTPTRTDTGDYTLTLDNSVVSVHSVQLTFLGDGDEDIVCQVNAINDGTTDPCTVTLSTLTGATPADGDAGDSIMWTIWCRNTSVTRP